MHLTRLPRGQLARWSRVALALTITGCASSQAQRHTRLQSELRRSAPQRGSPVQLGAPEDPDSSAVPPSELDRAGFVRAVLARNPNVEAARQAFRAALSQYPQAKALEDPTLAYSLAPLSIASDEVQFGQRIALSQRFPWPGKLSLAGEMALAEAEAAREDYQATRLRLAMLAASLFDQYYAAARALALNAEHEVLVQDIKAAAEAQYRAGRASQQEPLQAELELSHVLHQRVVLGARLAITRAQMNELLHREPQAELAPPPAAREPDLSLPARSEDLQRQALQQRPELRGRQAKLRGRTAARQLAARQYYPDLGLMTEYNSMWTMDEHQWMLGATVNVPIQLAARRAAVEQAEGRLAQERANLSAVEAQIRSEVEQARQRLLEAQHVIRLYRERLMPTARAQIESARIAYATGRGGFQGLIDAERSLRSLELSYEEALAALGQRSAELSRALGQTAGLLAEEVEP